MSKIFEKNLRKYFIRKKVDLNNGLFDLIIKERQKSNSYLTRVILQIHKKEELHTMKTLRVLLHLRISAMKLIDLMCLCRAYQNEKVLRILSKQQGLHETQLLFALRRLQIARTPWFFQIFREKNSSQKNLDLLLERFEELR